MFQKIKIVEKFDEKNQMDNLLAEKFIDPKICKSYIFFRTQPLSVAGSGQGILLLVGSVSTCPVLPKNTWVHHVHNYSRCVIDHLVRSSLVCLKLCHPIPELDSV